MPVKNFKSRRNLFLLMLDVFLLASFILVNRVKETGIAFHEWFGVFLGLVLLFHLTLHWNWVTGMIKQFFKIKKPLQYVKFAVDALILIGFFTIIISGILMSRSLLPALGLTGLHSFTLKILHVTATRATIYLTAAHMLLNLKWILKVIGRLFTKPAKPAGRGLLQSD